VDDLEASFFKAVGGVYSHDEAARIGGAAAWSKARLAGQLRASGEPAFFHDLRVARILLELGMDADSVVAGLLHDALDSALTAGGLDGATGGAAVAPGRPSGKVDAKAQAKTVREEVAAELIARFGESTESIVEGVSKLAALKAKNKTVQAAETIRKMLFAMTRDIRVILVKLADKLDNMRTLKYLPEERQKDIASECIDIFAPLADRLGVSWMKDELEDLSLKALNREAYDQIKSIVAAKKGEREKYLARVEAAVREASAAEGLTVEIQARAKHFYSIYQKMRKKGKTPEELYDLLGVRLICESDNDCYTLLGIVHRIWKPIDGRFKDYIAMPKANGYRSLHTTVMGFEGRLLEVQIRTSDMHRVAEYGVASHWLYKKGMTAETPRPEDLPIVNRLKEWSEFLSQGAEYLEEIKRELLKDSIFVFTPQGDVVQLPAGAGPLDFAYAIHTDIGNRCMGAKADGQIVPLDGELKNTQVVEILTSPQAHPTMNWLPLAKTSKARQRIRAALIQSGEVLAIDRNIVAGRRAPSAEEHRAQGHSQSEEKKPKEEKASREGMVEQHIVHEPAEEGHGATTVYRRVEPGEAVRNENAGVAIGGAKNLMIRIAGCCRPVTGDAIVGYVSRGRGIIVHRADCTSVAAIPDFAERRIEVSWESTASFTTARFRLTAKRSPDLFAEIEAAVRKFQGHLREGRLGERGDGTMSGSFTMEVEAREDVKKALKAIRSIPMVLSIEEDE
jgi:GTP diphosphokinase / guanosine-3',5'-bis(diphosphate) 3'-diphosphatase